MGIRKRSHKIEIILCKWTVTFYPPEEYLKIVGPDSYAETDTDTKKICFDLGALTEDLVRHELGHAYLAEMSFVQLQLNTDQYEEFFCEMLAKYGKRLTDQALKIYKIGKTLK